MPSNSVDSPLTSFNEQSLSMPPVTGPILISTDTEIVKAQYHLPQQNTVHLQYPVMSAFQPVDTATQRDLRFDVSVKNNESTYYGLCFQL